MRRGRAEDAMPNHRRPPRIHSVLCAKALFFREHDPMELTNDRSRRRAELPRRSAGARFVAIRGRPDLHRGFGPARRRGRQGGEPEGRRARPHPRHRPQARGRRLLFHDLQRQQKIGDGQSEIAARCCARQGHGEKGGRLYRKHGARHDREIGAGLGRTARAEPAPDLCPGQRFWRGQPLRAQPRLRHDRAGLRRQHGDHRRGGPPAGAAGTDLRRHRHRHADGDLGRQRAVPAPHDRAGAAAAGRDAGRAAQLHARRLYQLCAHRRAAGARPRRVWSADPAQ